MTYRTPQTKERIETLKKLGLTKNEARCYFELWSNGGLLPIKFVASMIGVSKHAVYRLFNALEAKGFISVSQIGPKRFRAIPPSVAIKKWSANRKLEFEKSTDEALEALSKRY